MDISSLGESLFSIAHHALQFDAAQPELRAACYNALRDVGFDLRRLKSLPIGLFTNPPEMKDGLLNAGFSKNEIVASGLTGDPRLAERLIGPIRDLRGRIVSFWARHPQDIAPKYLFLNRNWRDQVPAFGLDAARSGLSDAANELLLVEDLLDAILLQSAGLPQVAAALGFSRYFAKTRWEHLARLGVERVTLVPGDDGGALVRAASARDAALHSGPAPEVFLLLPESIGCVKNLAGIIRQTSRDSFWAWLKYNRVPRTDDLAESARYMTPMAGDADWMPDLPEDDSDDPEMPSPVEHNHVEPQRPSSLSGLCPLHFCDPMFCFCWD